MSSPTFSAALSGLIEQPNSGGVEIGQQTRLIQVLKGKLTLCKSSAPYRGQFGTGDYAGYRVDSVRITPEKGELAVMEIVYTAGSGSGVQLPTDTWRMEAFEDNPRIERHTRYSGLEAITDELANVQTAVQGKSKAERDDAYDDLSATGKELVDKMRLGQESFYQAGRRYIWTRYSYTPPAAVDGGYTETPTGPGAAYLNGTFDWLRQADDVEYDNGAYRITSSWIGAPNGHWDSDIYS